MAIGCWASPGKGGALCRLSVSACGFCGNLIRTHLGGRLEAGLNWNNPDPKQRENNLPKSLGEMIPAEQLPRVGVCGRAGGLSLRGGGQLSALGELHRAVGWRGDSERGLGFEAQALGLPAAPVLCGLQVSGAALLVLRKLTLAALATCQALY